MSDFDDIARLLRERRPELSPLELDQVKQRVRKRADRTQGKGQPMKSRLAILMMLVAGVMVGTTGAGLAVQGATGNGNAAQEQYPSEQPTGGVLGEEESGGGSDVTPTTQVGRQVEAGVQGAGEQAGSTGELPFTGLAAIPIILLGLALTVTGLVLRRRVGSSDA